MKLKQRFEGAIGREYVLFEETYPHFNELQEAVANQISEHFQGETNYSVLELGCGPGPTTWRILDAVPDVHVTAIDNEPVMIDQAKKFLQQFTERLTLVTEDILEYLKGVTDSTFDSVASGWTIHNFESRYRKEVIKEIYRVLKPGGLFVNGDKYAQDNLEKRLGDFNWSIQQLIEKMAHKGNNKICYEWILHMEIDESPNILMKETESIDLLKKEGFSDPKIIWREKMEAVMVATKENFDIEISLKKE